MKNPHKFTAIATGDGVHVHIFCEKCGQTPGQVHLMHDSMECFFGESQQDRQQPHPEDPPWWPQYARENGHVGMRFLDIIDCQKELACHWAKVIWRKSQ